MFWKFRNKESLSILFFVNTDENVIYRRTVLEELAQTRFWFIQTHTLIWHTMKTE